MWQRQDGRFRNDAETPGARKLFEPMNQFQLLLQNQPLKIGGEPVEPWCCRHISSTMHIISTSQALPALCIMGIGDRARAGKKIQEFVILVVDRITPATSIALLDEAPQFRVELRTVLYAHS